MPAIKSGLKLFDDQTDNGIEYGTLNLVVGRSIPITILLNFAYGYVNNGKKVTFFTDTLPAYKLLSRYIVHSTKTPYKEVLKSNAFYESAIDDDNKFKVTSYNGMSVGDIKKYLNKFTSMSDTPIIMLDSVIGLIPEKTYPGMTMYDQERQVMLELKQLAIKSNTIIWIADYYLENMDTPDIQESNIQGSKIKSQLVDTLLLYIPNAGAREVGLASFQIPIINDEPSGVRITFKMNWSTLSFESELDRPSTPIQPIIRTTGKTLMEKTTKTSLKALGQSTKITKKKPKLY